MEIKNSMPDSISDVQNEIIEEFSFLGNDRESTIFFIIMEDGLGAYFPLDAQDNKRKPTATIVIVMAMRVLFILTIFAYPSFRIISVYSS